MRAANNLIETGWGHASQHQWDEVEADFAQAARRRPDLALVWEERCDSHLRLGLRDRAADDSLRALQVQEPGFAWFWYRHAVLCLHVGDVQGYRQACARMVKRSGQTNDRELLYELAHSCVLVPDPVVDPQRVLRFAEMGKGGRHEAWHLASLGAAHYRAGHYERAHYLLLESLNANPQWSGRALIPAVLAMACQRRGQAGDARRELQNAARVEAGKRPNLVNGENVEHLDISGLTFRFTPSMWDLTAAPWDFSTTPWGLRADMHPGCVRVWGSGKGIRIANCLFEHVFFPIRIRALLDGQRVDDVRIEDNEFRHTDNGILAVEDGSAWGYAKLRGRLGDVRIYRNRSFETGTRPARYSSGTGITVSGARTVEVAGNVIERSYAQGIDVHGAKADGTWGDVPFTRILIHHNKVWESMLNCNDYGGIETWQGGPAYVFDNLSYDAQGYRNWERYTGKDAGFGHAYYLDGAFKNYHFNNIAWGKSKDAASPVANCSAFQEIISYQNTFFQNTAYNFHEGSRRQEPAAGRNKYLGNVWDGMGQYVFRHADPARTEAEGNARDAGTRGGRFALETDAYGRNVFHDFAEMGVLEPSGRWLRTFDAFQGALRKHKALLCGLGAVRKTSPLRDPARGDFRPVSGAAGVGKGARVFVPWALSGVVGEWNFYPAGDDPADLIDEHWYMTDYHVSRDQYHQRPTYPLKGANVTQEDYLQGPLEDWIRGALHFSPAKKQYATLSNAEMMRPFAFRELRKSRHENARPESCMVEGEALKNPQIYTSNMLIEVYFRTAPGHTGGVLMEKMKGNGYSLTVGAAGRLSFHVQGPGASATAESKARVNDGRWHHALVEADRRARALTVYADGRKDGSAEGVGASVSLANEGDVCVGGTPEGRYLDGAVDFLRIAQGTLADADTTIEELYAWEFDGPQRRDFTGRKPAGARNAGALEFAP